MKTLLCIAAFLLCVTGVQAQPRLVRVLGQLISPFGTQWNDSSERLITYNSQGQPYLQTINYFNQTGANWHPAQQEITSYSNSSFKTNTTAYKWGNTSTNWGTSPFFTKDYRYNVSTGVEAIEWHYTNPSTSVTDSFIYNTSGLLTERLAGNMKTLYTYTNAGELTETMCQFWNNTVWLNSNRISHTHDVSGNLISEIEEFWDAANNAWVTNFRYTYSYNTNGMLDNVLKEHLDGSTWNNFGRDLYFYSTATAITKINEDDHFAVYPNPSTGIFTIATKFEEQDALLTVSDMAGRQILSRHYTGNETLINLTGVDKGFYLLQLQTAGGLQVSKLKVE